MSEADPTPTQRPPRMRCRAQVYKPDCHRRTGRGKTGFEMHYIKDQCSRSAKGDSKRCWQHPVELGFMDCPWAKEFMANEKEA